jgi:hypothetical protein
LLYKLLVQVYRDQSSSSTLERFSLALFKGNGFCASSLDHERKKQKKERQACLFLLDFFSFSLFFEGWLQEYEYNNELRKKTTTKKKKNNNKK